MVSLKSWSIVEFKIKKNFLIFVFEELSRIEVFCEHDVLFTFIVIFLKTKISSIKIVIQN